MFCYISFVERTLIASFATFLCLLVLACLAKRWTNKNQSALWFSPETDLQCYQTKFSTLFFDFLTSLTYLFCLVQKSKKSSHIWSMDFIGGLFLPKKDKRCNDSVVSKNQLSLYWKDSQLKKTLAQIGSLTAEHKASYSLVFSDIKYRQNIAGR